MMGPDPANILDGALPHIRHAVSVTEQHGLQIKHIEVEASDLNPHPYRAKGDRTVTELDSFLDELDRRKLTEEEGTLWGSSKRGVLFAVYNDHTGDTPGWRDDRLVLQLTPDEDWQKWHQLSGTFHNQNTFGDHVEELLHTVKRPDQAELLEVIDSIRASTSGEFESRITRANGARQLVYKVEHDVKAGRTGQLEIPETITLTLRPWEGHPETYDVDAWFRTNIKDGALTLSIKLKPTRQIIRTAWAKVVSCVGEQTSLNVYAVA